MRSFYVRPEREARYGTGDGTSYNNAWNGLASVDWDALATCASARVIFCGERVVALEVHWRQ